MNFTQSFEEFSKGLSTTDIALYAGAGIILWIVFKEKLSPVQTFILSLINKAKSLSGSSSTTPTPVVGANSQQEEDIFFRLVVSWKQTRDLAEKSGCTDAVKVADAMFPYLSPQVCGKDKTV